MQRKRGGLQYNTDNMTLKSIGNTNEMLKDKWTEKYGFILFFNFKTIVPHLFTVELWDKKIKNKMQERVGFTLI